MAGTINPQDAAENVISLLSPNLGTKFDALDTSYGDGITLPDVDNYWRAPQAQYPAGLNLVVVGSETNPTNSPDQTQQHTLLIEVVLTEGGSSTSYTATELLHIKLWRIVRGIQEVLNKTTLSDNVDKIYLTSAEATEIDSVPGNRFMQRAELEFIVFTST